MSEPKDSGSKAPPPSADENDGRRALQWVTGGRLVNQEVRRAGRQLALAGRVGGQLSLDDARRRWVALLKGIPANHAAHILSARMPLDNELLKRFEDMWNWEDILGNPSLTSSLVATLMTHYADQSEKEVDERILPYELSNRLSSSEHLPWSVELIEQVADLWEWDLLSGNSSLPWSESLLRRYECLWSWPALSRSEYLPWSIELLKQFEDQWNWGWGGLSGNESLPWSIELLQQFEDRWNWEVLSGNKLLPWSTELLQQFLDPPLRDSIIWDSIVSTAESRLSSVWKTISGNSSIPWSLELIRKFEDRWDWRELSESLFLPWSVELLKQFEDRWDWHALSCNRSIDNELLFEFKDKWWDLGAFGSWGTSQPFPNRYVATVSYRTVETVRGSVELARAFKISAPSVVGGVGEGVRESVGLAYAFRLRAPAMVPGTAEAV